MENVLISACLLGTACRYDGLSKPLASDVLNALKSKYHLIPVCPEIMGGLPTPRIPSEIAPCGDVLREDGIDVTEQYRRGAEEALRLAALFECKLAIFKERSPSCGSGSIYDGTFTKTLIKGDGIAASLLKKNGIRVIGEHEAVDLLAR
ncbi:MAG: DUF523 domain-containing protein [Clostridia bacterium]|nr:DUF523 domain-containing protein [Clostridia bacterium]